MTSHHCSFEGGGRASFLAIGVCFCFPCNSSLPTVSHFGEIAQSCFITNDSCAS